MKENKNVLEVVAETEILGKNIKRKFRRKWSMI